MNCFSCEAPLVMDPHCRGDYQYDNALWIGFHGGYGMFVDNLDAIMPNNTEDRWLRDPDGEYTTIDGLDGRPHVIDDPDWIPTFNEPRVLPGTPDYEVVICHDCAHRLWAFMFEKLIPAADTHAHREEWKKANPGHYGWDYEREET